MTSTPLKWDDFPSYFQLLHSFWKYLNGELRNDMSLKIDRLPEEYRINYNFNVFDVTIVLTIAIICTVLRNLSSKLLFEPIGKKCKLTLSNQKKMPESGWKFAYSLCAWSYNFYVLILSGEFQLVQNPSTIWLGWNVLDPLPMKLYILYMVQCGFYFHSWYAVSFLDEWRKDSFLMLIHHFASLMLILFSYSLRYHNMGALVFFSHDICDVFLELSKLNVYFRKQNGKMIKIYILLSNLSFLCFIIVWIAGRLYLYPLRVLYNTMNNVPCISIINILLWTLQIINIYWTFLILKVIFLIVGLRGKPEDIREYDDQEMEYPKKEHDS